MKPERLLAALPWLVGLAGAALFLRPLAAHPGSTLLGRVFDYDAFVNLGDLGALHRHLSEGLQGRGFYDWLYGANFFYPQPRPLVISELMPLAALVTWPFGERIVLAHNVLLFAATVLNCVGGTAFARSLGARRLSSLVVGIAFAFGAYPNFQAGRLQLLFFFPIAFAYAATFRFARDARAQDAWLAATWAFVQAMLCLYYAMFLALSLPLVALAARASVRREGLVRDLARFALPFVVVLIPAAAILWPYHALQSKLGLARPLSELFQQSGDFMMFLWADAATLPGKLFRDVYKWDTAYYPGLVVLGAATVAIVVWLRKDLRARGPIVGLVALGAALMPLATVSALYLALLVGLALLVRLARRDRVSFLAPGLFAFAAVGLFLFGGPALRVWNHGTGMSPYAFVFEHVPFVDSMRMVRRAGLLVDLAMGGAAALLLSRIEAKRPLLVALAALVTFVEGIPFGVPAVAVPTRCEDAAYAKAHELGLAAIADLAPYELRHPELARRRWDAFLCRVATTVGPAGFVPAVADVADDEARTLPSPAAHAWLWDAGLRGVVVRGRSAWSDQRVLAMRPIAKEVVDLGLDRLVVLDAPAAPSVLLPSHLDGPRVKIAGISCSLGSGCERAIDGDDATRWTTRAHASGADSVILRFAPTTVAGLEWHTSGRPWDFPRGLRVEYQASPGVWRVWREVRSISASGLGTDAVHPSYALALPPEKTDAVRLTELGQSARFWLSATELQVIAAR